MAVHDYICTNYGALLLNKTTRKIPLRLCIILHIWMKGKAVGVKAAADCLGEAAKMAQRLLIGWGKATELG